MRLAPVLSICLCSCSAAKSQKTNRNSLKTHRQMKTNEVTVPFSDCFLFCQFRDSTVDSRCTCYCAVTICHSCTVIVSFCSSASKLIQDDRSRTLTQKEASAGGEMEDLSLLPYGFVTPPFYICLTCEVIS